MAIVFTVYLSRHCHTEPLLRSMMLNSMTPDKNLQEPARTCKFLLVLGTEKSFQSMYTILVIQFSVIPTEW